MSLENSKNTVAAIGTICDLTNSIEEHTLWKEFRDNASSWIASEHTRQSRAEAEDRLGRILKSAKLKASERISMLTAFEAITQQSENPEKARSDLESALVSALDRLTFIKIAGAKAKDKVLFKDAEGKSLGMKTENKQEHLSFIAQTMSQYEKDVEELGLDPSELSFAKTHLSKHYFSTYGVEFLGKQKKDQGKSKAPANESPKKDKKAAKKPDDFFTRLAATLRSPPKAGTKKPARPPSIKSNEGDPDQDFVSKTISRASTTESLDIKRVEGKDGKSYFVTKSGTGKAGGWVQRKSGGSTANRSQPVSDRTKTGNKPTAKSNKHKPKKRPGFTAEANGPEVDEATSDPVGVVDAQDQEEEKVTNDQTVETVPEPLTEMTEVSVPILVEPAVVEEQPQPKDGDAGTLAGEAEQDDQGLQIGAGQEATDDTTAPSNPGESSQGNGGPLPGVVEGQVVEPLENPGRATETPDDVIEGQPIPVAVSEGAT